MFEFIFLFFSWFEFYGQASSSSSFFVGNEMGGSFRGDELPRKGVLDSRTDKKRGWLWVHSKKGSFPSFPFPYIWNGKRKREKRAISSWGK